MTKITTRDDLAAWVANNNPENYLVSSNADEMHERIVDALVQSDHPNWGDDWEEYLDAFDFAAVVDAIATES